MTTTSTDRTSRIGDIVFKAPCLAASTAALTLSGEQTIDGVACTSGNRVLVKNQASSVNNGIYVVDTGEWSRSTDCDGSYDMTYGTMVYVTPGGTVNGNTMWRQASTGNPVPGTDALTFATAATTDSSLISFLASGTGAVSRSFQSKARDIFSAKDFGATGDGTTDDAAAIQLALDAAAVAGGDVYIPAGAYKLGAVLLVGSNTRIYGEGFSSRLFCTATSSGVNMAWIGGTQWFIFLNSNAVTDTGNSNIEITQLFLDFSLRPTVGHNIHMHKVNAVRIHDNWIKYGNDAVSLTACFDFQVTNNKAWNQNNACYDVWEASYDGLIANNIGRNVDGYGVILTGNNTLEQTGITKNITIANNILIGPDSGTASVGVWLQGGMTWTTNGCRHCAVTGNYMYGYYNGVKITGGRFNTVMANTIERCYEAGVQFGFETAGNETTYCVASGNTLDDCSYNATSYPIEFQNNVSFNTASGNIVGTHSAAYALGFYAGTANNIAADNTLKAGSTGTVINAGAATNVVYGANASGIWETSGNYISLDNSAGTKLRMGYGTAAPASGTWKLGEIVFNATPSVGQPKGWTCTVAGTPGTWVSLGNL